MISRRCLPEDDESVLVPRLHPVAQERLARSRAGMRLGYDNAAVFDE